MSGIDRIAMAGAFWERGEPLTDEVWATRQYVDQMRERYSTYSPPQRVGPLAPEPDWQQIAGQLHGGRGYLDRDLHSATQRNRLRKACDDIPEVVLDYLSQEIIELIDCEKYIAEVRRKAGLKP